MMETGNIKVLLIEDNPDDTELLLRKLGKSAGGQLAVETVKSLHDALEYIAENKPDIILSDLGLPDSHGLDTVTKIMCEAPHIPLVVLSGFDDEATAIKAVQSGAQDYLVKGQLEGRQIERSLFYAIERATLQSELEQHAQEISKIQSNLLKILEKNADAIIVVGEKGRILFANPAAESLLGRKKKDLINESFKYPLKKSKKSEIIINRHGQRDTVAEMNEVEINWEGKPAYLASLRDITERKQMEEALRESEDKFYKAFRHSPDGIVISSIDDGTIVEANDSFLRLTGYTRDEVIDRKSLELGLWAKPEERPTIIKTLKDEGTVTNRECQFRMKNGEILTWLFSAEIINIKDTPYMLSVTTDITERKKVEEKLRYSDTALNSLHEGVFAMDAEFKITRWNEICEQMLGIKAAEAIGKVPGDVFEMVEEYPGQNEKRFALLMSRGFNQEEQIYHTPRGDIWVDVHAQAIEENGKRYGWVTLLTDITDRKKAEEELRFSHAALRSIHESVIATDTKYVITHWNDISEQMYGIRAEEAIGKKLMDAIEIEENLPGENERRIKKLESAGYYLEEQLHRTRHGEVWVDVSVQAIEQDGKRYGWIMLGSAITQRKLAEEALKRSEEKYRELISTSTDGIVAIDPDMRVIIWNQGAEKIFGYNEKEILGQPVMKIIPEREHQKTQQLLRRLTKAGAEKPSARILEGYGLRKDGRQVPIELSLSARKYEDTYIATAIIRDVTERKEAEEKLRKSEERYRDLFENASELIQSVSRDGRFLYVNRAWREALGYGEQEVARLSLWDIIHPDHQAHCREIFSKVLEGETTHIETVFVARDGRAIYVEGNANNYFHEKKVTATRGIFQDITERKEAEEKLRKIDQMKSEFLSNISHELRTPLQSIGGFTKLLMNGQVPDAATQQEFLQIIDREALHLGNLINQLLDLSRLESGQFQINRKLISIRDTVIDSIKSFHTLSRDKNITLNEEIPAGLPEIEADEERIRQVFINLLSNAIKYSDPGGSVKVRAEKRGGDLLFQVIDHGIGMSPEARKHLFERFYRAEDKLARGGTGLGLYITRQIIEAHGGHIWVESKVDEGSTFSFNLPLNVTGGEHDKKNTGHRRRPRHIAAGGLLTKA
jgi:PAS domain S-box-containing protein